MKLTIGLLITFSACCFGVNPDNNTRIFGGNFALKNQFPHQVALLYKGSLRCGGSILSELWVLTAAHCVKNGLTSLNDLTICAGSNSISNCVTRAIELSIPHEKFVKFQHDIALVRLVKPLEFSESIKSIQIVTEEIPLNSLVTIMGWGKESKEGPTIDKMKFASVIVASDCGGKFAGIICLGHKRNTGGCLGDSGGGAIYQNKLAGIGDFILLNCGLDRADSYTKVSYYADWIHEKMNFV